MLRHVPFFSSLLERDLNGGKPKHSHVLMYGAIEAHSLGPKGCIATNLTLGKECGVTAATAANLISELSKAGWIKVIMTEKSHRMAIVPLGVIAMGNPSLPDEGVDSSTDEGGSLSSETLYIENTVEKVSIAVAKKKKLELKNDSSEVNSMLIYFFSKLVPAEQSGARFSPSNRTCMDSMLSTYGIPRVRGTIDKAKELLSDTYAKKYHVTSVRGLMYSFEGIEGYKTTSKGTAQPTKRF